MDQDCQLISENIIFQFEHITGKEGQGSNTCPKITNGTHALTTWLKVLDDKRKSY